MSDQQPTSGGTRTAEWAELAGRAGHPGIACWR